MSSQFLSVRGAREHNLKSIDVDIPRDKLVVITGLSGSGKSSLAFDTIYAEGQRRYVESLSAYARQFLGLMKKPDVDQIDGLSPAISIDQKGTSRNPRSTVGTVTEIYDYLRLLFARIGHPHCPQCGRPITQQSSDQVVDALLDMPDNSKLLLLAPVVTGRKGEHKAIFEDLRKNGYVRVRVDGEVHDLDETLVLDRYKKHDIEVVVDRVAIRHEGEHATPRARLADSVETALQLGDGFMTVTDVTDREHPHDHVFSEKYACVYCGISLPEIEPRTFSFNSPAGACPACDGLGVQMEFSPDLIIPDADLSIDQGAIVPWRGSWDNSGAYYHNLVRATCRRYGIPSDVPWHELSRKQQDFILYGGSGKNPVVVTYRNRAGQERSFGTKWKGVVTNLRRRHRETSSSYIREWLERFMASRPCPVCHGKRLRPEALAVTIDDKNIADITDLSVKEALQWVVGLQGGAMRHRPGEDVTVMPAHSPLTQKEWTIARQVLREIEARLGFLNDVGLGYITLSRSATTLSGGESQRIRLATQIGSQLMGVLYVLDEPSIGLHQRDNNKLIGALSRMRDLGNTVLVVEHDEETIRAADWIVDLGPRAGLHGGEVIAAGPLATILASKASLTGQYLRGERSIPVPATRRPGNGAEIILRGASEHNLKQIDVHFPLGKLICVTGVSGSGKSSLVVDTLYRIMSRQLYRAKAAPGRYRSIAGLEQIDKVIDINQAPIGRTPRSNPATYTGVFTPIRELFARLPESRTRGYKAGRFSFNVKGGRCEVCRGDGIIKVEMQFLPDIYVPCESCHGQRYNKETLQIKYKGKSIANVLDMTVEEALHFFENYPAVRNRLQTLADVGLGYLHLGQPATQLSGGEAQRIKLAKELSRRATGKTFYILDEPTTGLHFHDVAKLMAVLHRLVDQGNTVLVIEHNLDVIKSADWIIDLGPEGGDEGGYVVAEGTPEAVARVEKSYTGQYLRKVLPAGNTGSTA